MRARTGTSPEAPLAFATVLLERVWGGAGEGDGLVVGTVTVASTSELEALPFLVGARLYPLRQGRHTTRC
jgi:hypothetical protein